MFSLRSKNKADGNVVITANKRSIVKFWGIFFIMLLGFVALLQAIQQAAGALVLIFTAFFLALALNAPVQWVAQHIPGKRRGSRSLATLLSVMLVIAIVASFIASIIPPFIRQTGGLVNTVPSFVRDLRSQDSEVGSFIHRYNLESQIDSFSDDLSNRLQGLAGSVGSVVAGIGSSTFALLTVLVLTFMMLVEGPRWIRLAEQLIPDDKREHARELTRAMYKVVKGYVNGQVTLAAIAAALILPVLFIVGVSYPLALMAVVFICGLIPMVGHLIGATIVTIVALFTSPLAAVIVLAYYILYQQIENYLIQPKVQANSTNMSPLLVFVAVVLGVNFGGLLGGLVAIPVMGCIRILVLDQLTRRKILKSPTAKKTLKDAEAQDQKK